MQDQLHRFACLTVAIIAFLLPSCASDNESPTTDGAAELWETIELPTSAEVHAIQFLDEDRGYLAGGGHLVNGGLMGQTTNGGLTWNFNSGYSHSRKTAFALYDTWFHDDDRAFLAGYGGLLLRSETGWKGFEKPRFKAPPVGHIRDLHFVDDDYGWAMGERGLLATEDGGREWTWVRRSMASTGYFKSRAIHFVDRRRGHLAGKFAKLQRTFDGGTTWEDPEKKPTWPKDPDLFGLYFANTRKGWAVGETGTIVHTDDGGATWVAQKSGVRDFLMDVAFQDEDRGWAVGFDRSLSRSVVLGTSDGGATWFTELEVPDEELRVVFALPSGHVWAVGGHIGRGPQKLLRRLPSR